MELHERIAFVRKAAGPTQEQLGEKLGFRKVAIRENSWTDQLGNPQSAVDYALYPENFLDFAL